MGTSAELKLNITDIGELATHYHRALNADEVRDLLGSVDVQIFDGVAEAELALEVSRAKETLSVKGRIRGAFQVNCGRCLAPAKVSVDEADVHLRFLPSVDTEVDEEGLEGDEIDTFSHDGQALDMRALLRDYLVAAIPIAPVCNWDCKGICSDCGLNLNETQCGCPSRQEPANKWAAALQDIKKRGVS